MAYPDSRRDPHIRPVAAALLCCALLAGCGGYDVVRSGNAGHYAVLAPHSVKVVLYDRDIELKVSRHERGWSAAPPDAEDKRQAHTRAVEVRKVLVPALFKGVSDQLAPYANYRDPTFQLSLQITRIVMDTDGSAEVNVTATLSRVGRGDIWLRTVRSIRSRFGSDAGLADDLAHAVLAELRASGLIA